jgi:hypothetical protein
LLLSRQEAEEISSALHSYLHHPTKQGVNETWVTYREMPQIKDNETLQEIVLSWDAEIVKPIILVENLSEMHVSKIYCLVFCNSDKSSMWDSDEYDQETNEIRCEIQLNLAPQESGTFQFENLPARSKILSVNIEKGYGYKIDLPKD